MKSTLEVYNPFMTCRYTCISEHLQVAAFYMVKLYAMWDNYLCVVICEASIATTASLSYFSTVVSPMRTELQ